MTGTKRRTTSELRTRAAEREAPAREVAPDEDQESASPERLLSPQEYYREIVETPEGRELLRRLAEM